MRILITGGAGYVGGFLTDLLIKNGYAVTVYDNLVYEQRFLKNVPFIFGDIRDTAKLASILPNFDAVIWLAGVVGDGACQINPLLTKEINEDATKWLVDNYQGKIIFPSTCSVYGVNNDLIDEDAQPNPLSSYAITKLAAEQYILHNAKDFLIFRLGTLFGLSDEHSRIRLDLVVNILTKRAIAGEELKVFGGDQWRPLLHVKDVAYAMEYGLRNKITGLYNLSLGNWRICDIAKAIADTIGNVKVSYHDIKFEDLRNYKVDNSKIRKTGWHWNHTLVDGIKEMAQTIKENRIKDTNDPVYSNVDYLMRIWK